MMHLKPRSLTSLLLAGSFAIATISGIVLYVKPKGDVANWIGWRLAGLNKAQWESLHTNACILLTVVAAVHLFLNWRVFWSYLRKRTVGVPLKSEMIVTAVLLVALCVGTILDVAPFSSTAQLGDAIKKYWERSGESLGPAPNAESFSIERFARSINLSPEELVALFRQEGLVFSGQDVTIKQLASDNGMSPAEIYTTITKHHSDVIRRATETEPPSLPATP